MGLYMTGLLLDGERKSIEPIAAIDRRRTFEVLPVITALLDLGGRSSLCAVESLPLTRSSADSLALT
jgi:hypothetical protein